jgi:hypothetical protein
VKAGGTFRGEDTAVGVAAAIGRAIR